MGDSGRRFGFKQCLGSGGFGEVYLASMTQASGVETEVAVKMLHEGLDPRSQAVQRLRDEGRLLGSLNHPSVLKVHDLVLLEERVALVMEYVPGLDLEQCVELPRPIGLRAGLEVVAHVADALHVAFDSPGPDGEPLRLVHRDIKPPNIRIGLHGEVKVLDFGIAKASDARREAKTQTSVMIGSPWYMAPERFDGKNDGAPADVYALGCSLYEVAAQGGRLFSELSSREHFLLALDPAGHDQHVKEHLHPLSIPPDVRWLLDRMLAFREEDRPTTHEVSERAEELAEAVGGETLRRWCKTLDWPSVPSSEGLLVGRVVTEHRLSHVEDVPPREPREAAPITGTFVLEDDPAASHVRASPGSEPAAPPPQHEPPPLPSLPSLPTPTLPTFDVNQSAAPPAPPAVQRPAVVRSAPPTRHSPVPLANHLIVPGVLTVVAVSVLSIFGFFFFICALGAVA